jgi:signal transduction histidine kinase
MESQQTLERQATASGQVVALDSPERDYFRNNELLAGISEETYAQIKSRIEVMRYESRQVIFHEDEPGDCLYLIAQGSVKISKKGRASQQETLAHLLERDFFGEMALIDNGRRSAQAAAVGDVVLGLVDRAAWDLLLHLAPHEVLSNFTRSVTKRLRQNNQHFIEQMMRAERLSLLGTTISSIVHDMNNPISQILIACTIIQSEAHDEPPDKMVQMIRDAVERMDVMTRELIDFSHGNTRLRLRSVSVSDLLRGLEPDFARCRAKIEVRIEALYDGLLRADLHRLLRVFGNLIRNAREAMKGGTHNELCFSVKRRDANYVRFEVSDTGCGIPSHLLPEIFEPFITHGKPNGTGLGLAISKAVVEAHHGFISVSSSDKGTSFQIDLPLNIQETATNGPSRHV